MKTFDSFNDAVAKQVYSLMVNSRKAARLYLGYQERSMLNEFLLQQWTTTEADIKGTSDLEFQGLKVIFVTKSSYFKVEGD